jgi:hypothetical protein
LYNGDLCLCYDIAMKKHIAFFATLLALIFAIEGIAFLFSVASSYEAGFRGAALLSVFIALVHFFIATGLVMRKKWAPHLGIFFLLYIVVNFIISNSQALFTETLLPSALTVLSVSAFLTISLFLLKDEFTH